MKKVCIILSTVLVVGASLASNLRADEPTSGFPPIPPGAIFDELKPTFLSARGQLVGVPEGERFLDKNTLLNREAYNNAYGQTNFGMGPIPERDSFTTGWWRKPESEKKQLRTAIREKLFSELTKQNMGLDPRTIPLAWSDATFHTQRWIEFNNGLMKHRAVELEFTFKSPLYGILIPGRIFVPEEVLRGNTPAPAVIYQHFHGTSFPYGSSEIFGSWHLVGEGTPAAVLTKLGFVVISTDVQGFRRRRLHDEFRDNKAQAKELSQLATARHGGQFGADPEFIGDSQDIIADIRFLVGKGSSRYALRTFEDYIMFRLTQLLPYVDNSRVFSMGMSMGGVRTWTLAALAGDKLKGAVSNGTFPRFFLTLKVGPHNHNDAHHLAGQFGLTLPELGIPYLDSEHYLFAALATNFYVQMGETDPSSLGWRESFDMLAEASAGNAKFFHQDREPSGHEFTQRNLINAYSFFYRLAFNKELKDNPKLRLWGTF